MAVPALRTPCGDGLGLAVCPALGLLVTSNSDDDTLSVFDLPARDTAFINRPGGDTGMQRVCTLGGPGSPLPLQFRFNYFSGWMAFSCGAVPTVPPLLLLVTEAGNNTVHVIDVVGQVHVGFVAAPGSIPGPRGVAARCSLVAVSVWKDLHSGDHTVRLFEGSGAVWTPLRVLGDGFGAPGRADGQLKYPHGLRFTGTGSRVVVADRGNDRLSVFAVGDGSFVKHIAMGLRAPFDVEECEGGWLVACGASETVEFVGSGDVVGRPTLGKPGRLDGEFDRPSALGLVPGTGLVVRDSYNCRVQVFVTPDAIAMAAMSTARVGWMVAVVRAVRRRVLSTHPRAPPTRARRRRPVEGL